MWVLPAWPTIPRVPGECSEAKPSGRRHGFRVYPRLALNAGKSGQPDLRGPSARLAKHLNCRPVLWPLDPGSSRACARSAGTRDRSESQLVGQIAPLRVHLLDQCNLPSALPALQTAFTGTCFENRGVFLKIYQLVDSVLAG